MYGFSSALGEKYELGEFIAATRIESLGEDWMGTSNMEAGPNQARWREKGGGEDSL